MNNLETVIEFSTNRQWLGKPIKSTSDDGRSIQTYLGNEVHIGHEWINISATFQEAFLLLCEGYPIAPKLLDLTQSKTDANFASHQMVLIDFDNDSTTQQILADPVAQRFCSGFYTTASHNTENPRFRIIFLLETPISDKEGMKRIYRYFLRRYRSSDQSCKDSSRLFYGVVNPTEAEIFNKVLPSEFVKFAIDNQLKFEKSCADKLMKEQAMVKPSNKQFGELSEEKKTKILQLLSSKPVDRISYNAWLSFCWNFKALPNVTLADLINVCNIRFNDSNGCEKVWQSDKQGNVGVLINICKAEHGQDCFEIL